MRRARMKPKGKGVYFHLINRCGGEKSALPLSVQDKEFGMGLLSGMCQYYLLELISVVWMDNHYHIVLYAPGKAPSVEDAAMRYNCYYSGKKSELDSELNRLECEVIAEQMIDISHFMKNFQQQFTVRYNRLNSCRGSLWADRFKSVILDGNEEALWNCVKYVELNAVRAGIVEDPADYRFCSWGRYRGSGVHPFHDNFIKHLRSTVESHCGRDLSDEEILDEFEDQIARVMEREKREQVSASREEGDSKIRHKRESMSVRFMRRTRHWSDGAIIGSKSFVQEMGCLFEDKKKVMKKRMSQGKSPEGGVLHCFRRLRSGV